MPTKAGNLRIHPEVMFFVSIDIGTFTCRLAIGRADSGGRIKVIHKDRRITNLGQGIGTQPSLDSNAIARTVRVLQEWRTVIDAFPQRRERAVATSAVRDATNRAEFVSRAFGEADTRIDVISGEEEAGLTIVGMRYGLASPLPLVVAVDIGGGSTEIVYDPPAGTGRYGVRLARSIDIGAVRLTERFLQHEPPSADAVTAAEREVARMVEAAAADLGNLRGGQLVGTGGTITTLASLAVKSDRYDSHKVEQYCLGRAEVATLGRRLREMTLEERRSLRGMESGREAVIVGGTIVLESLMRTLSFQSCIVTDYGLREGILVTLAERSWDASTA